MRGYTVPAAVAAIFFALPALADDKVDASMRKLAVASGCVACHSVEAGKPGPGGGPPIGPAWQDVARKYAGNADAQRKLVSTVLQGSSPYMSHWKGKISGYAMPPNELEISEKDANRLVAWILALPR
jgi:cytochrome c